MTSASGTSTAPPVLTATRWSVVLLVVGAGMMIAFQMGKVPATIPTLQAELGLTLVDAGLVISLIYGMAALIGVVAGAFADGVGGRRAIVFGLFAACLGSVVGGLAENLWVLLGSRLIEGIGSVSVLVAAPGLLMRFTHARNLRITMGIYGTFMPLGIATMLLLTPLFLATIGWRGMWFANAGFVILFSVALWLGTASRPDPPSQPGRMGTFRTDLGGVLRSPGSWIISGCFGFYAFCFLSIVSFLPKYLIQERSWEAAPAAIITALIILANAGGNLLGGWLAHRGVARWVLIATALGTMGATSWFIYQPWVTDFVRIMLAFVFTFVAGFLPASVYNSVQIHAPDPSKVAGVNGLILQCTNIGQLSGPPVFAAIVAANSWSVGPWAIVGSAILGVMLAISLGVVERRMDARKL